MDTLTTSREHAASGTRSAGQWDEAQFLQALDAEFESCLAACDDRPPVLLEAMRYAVLGPGKRLRPRLVGYACHAVGGDVRACLPAAAAVELVHAYSLVHDDLPAMDDDDLRRGLPTVHKRFDEATAVLAGDGLQALAFETLATRIADASVAARACGELAIAAGPAGMVGGQADDLSGSDAAPAAAEQRLAWLKRIHRRKTGAMITVSLRLGGFMGGANQNELDQLTRYGEAVGMAFQVTDDLLDAEGDEAAVGKRVGKDAALGKLTYPGLLGGEASRQHATALIDEAQAAIASLDERAEPLRGLARQIIERDR